MGRENSTDHLFWLQHLWIYVPHDWHRKRYACFIAIAENNYCIYLSYIVDIQFINMLTREEKNLYKNDKIDVFWI